MLGPGLSKLGHGVTMYLCSHKLHWKLWSKHACDCSCIQRERMLCQPTRVQWCHHSWLLVVENQQWSVNSDRPSMSQFSKQRLSFWKTNTTVPCQSWVIHQTLPFFSALVHHSPHLSLEGLYKITYMLWRRWEVLFGPRIPSRLQYCSYRRSLTTLIVLVLPPSLPYPPSRTTFINPTTPNRKRQAAVRASPLRKASRLKTSLAQLNSTIPTPQEAIT